MICFTVATAAILVASRALAVPVTVVDTANTSYDTIVVGAGVAGNLVAERMASSGAKTLLLERGPGSTAKSGGKNFMPWNDTVTVFDVPAFASALGQLPDSPYFCTDTASAAGCVFGGSGSVNALVWVPPTKWDFDDKWPQGWKYNDIKAAYARVEALNPGSTHPSSDRRVYETGIYHYVSAMLENENWTSVDAIKSPNEKYQVFGYAPENIIQGQGIRAGPADVWFSLALKNPNFSHQLESYVVRVVRNGTLATGVEVQSTDGSRYIVHLNKGGKVILTAGTLSTPRILFNSGIGPDDQIRIVQGGTTNVTLPPESDWINLPVGHNLRDHPIVHLTIDTEGGQNFTYFNASDLYFGGYSQADVSMYNKEAAGVIAQSPQRAISWTSVLGNDNLTHFIQATFEEAGPGKISILNYQTHGQTSFGALGIAANGTTLLLQKPWFNTEGDITASTAFVDQFRGYLDSSSTLTLDASLQNLTSRDIVVNHYSSGAHFLGTTIIGEQHDGKSVVDLNTKVWGTQNIFVADGSFHPDVPTGNTQAIIAIAAEMAVEKISAYKV